MEPRTLSSKQTPWMIGFSAFWIVAFGCGTLAVWLLPMADNSGAPPPPEIKWIFLAGWTFATALISRQVFPLKRVRLAPGTLLVSNYRREISIPLSDIESVTQSFWQKHRPVTITLRQPSEFGDRIMFVPTILWSWRAWTWKPHPVVDELRALARRG